jgi:hypothetical protein
MKVKCLWPYTLTRCAVSDAKVPRSHTRVAEPLSLTQYNVFADVDTAVTHAFVTFTYLPPPATSKVLHHHTYLTSRIS